VADRNREAGERLASQYSATYFHKVEDLLSSGLCDAVDICLPTFLHESSFLAAAERGLHILCEKPVVTNLEAIDRILMAARTAGIKTMVAQVIRFWPEYRVIRQTMASGDLGQPRIANAARLVTPPRWGSWFRDPLLSGGALFDLHIHDLDFTYSLFGTPSSVYSVGVQGETGGWDHVLTTLDYGACKAHIEGGFVMPSGFPFEMRYRLDGDHGCIDFRFSTTNQVDQRNQASSELVLYREGMPLSYPARPPEDGYLAEIRYFVNCLEQDCHPETATLEEAREVIRIALAAQRSLETGTVVSL
jgi:predicted dehydrogenase